MGVIKKLELGGRKEIVFQYQYNKKSAFFSTGESDPNSEKVTEVHLALQNALIEVLQETPHPTCDIVYREFHRPKPTGGLGFNDQLDLSDLMYNFYASAKNANSSKEEYNPETIEHAFNLVTEFQESTGIYFMPFKTHNDKTIKPFMDNFVYWLLVKKGISTKDYYKILYAVSRGMRYGCNMWNPALGEISHKLLKFEIPPYFSEGFLRKEKLTHLIERRRTSDKEVEYFIDRLLTQCILGDPSFTPEVWGHPRTAFKFDINWNAYGRPIEYRMENVSDRTLPAVFKIAREMCRAFEESESYDVLTPFRPGGALNEEVIQVQKYPDALKAVGYADPIVLSPAIEQAQALIVPFYKSVDSQFILQSHINMMLDLDYEPMYIYSDVQSDYHKDPHLVNAALIACHNAGLGASQAPFQHTVPMMRG